MTLAIELIDYMITAVKFDLMGDEMTKRLVDKLEASALYLEMPRNHKVIFLNKYIELEDMIEKKKATVKQLKAKEEKNERREKDSTGGKHDSGDTKDVG